MKAQAPTTADLSTLLGRILAQEEEGVKQGAYDWRFDRIAALAREAQQADLTERLERSVKMAKSALDGGYYMDAKAKCGHLTSVQFKRDATEEEENAAVREVATHVCGLCESGILEGR